MSTSSGAQIQPDCFQDQRILLMEKNIGKCWIGKAGQVGVSA